MAELGTAVGRAGVKIEAVEIVHRQLETRVQMAENGREKVMQLCNTTDLSGKCTADDSCDTPDTCI